MSERFKLIAWFLLVSGSSTEIMLKPVVLRCGHSGCYDCYEKILATEQQSGRTKGLCAECSHQFEKDEVTINVAIRKLANNLKVTCANKGCLWKGKFPDAQTHGNNCDKRVVPCPNGCTFKCERENIPAHLPLCTKGKVDCPECGQKVERESVSHHESMFASVLGPIGCRTEILM